jgi:hypothetical protein
MDDNAKARLADEQADKLAAELAERTGLAASRSGWENIQVNAKGVNPHDPGGPYLLITQATDCGYPVDEHGGFPFGVCVGAYDAEGEPIPADASALWQIEPQDAVRVGADAVKTHMVEAIKGWKRRQQVLAAHALADRLTRRTGLHCQAEFTAADTGAVNAYLHHPETDGIRHVQITVHADAWPPVDEAGRYPEGVAVTQVNEHGDLTSVLWTLTASDARDADEDVIEDAIVDHLRDWAKAHPTPERSQPARGFDQAGSVRLHRELVLAWGPEVGDPGRWLFAATDVDGNVLDVVADCSPELVATVLPVAALGARSLHMAPPF